MTVTHRHSTTPTYYTWRSMLQRCSCRAWGDAKRKYYDRGIRVCRRWKKFENFLKDMGDRPPGTSIDRLENSIGYRPGNCRWATPVEQARNKRSNHRIEYDGKSLTLGEWAERLGIEGPTIRCRLKLGWSIQKVFETPVQNPRGFRFIEFRGKVLTITEWSRELGIKEFTIRSRLDILGWSVERALERVDGRSLRWKQGFGCQR